ncbi:hypothetical protein B0H12DRAFT_1138114 [Mycena haematopus]|nr:hypothetical protein B0H12DRAFT_1138114 [Mycena haematopus]
MRPGRDRADSPRSAYPTMPLSIDEFPQDVLLELAKYLDIADLISFLSICRGIRELQSERTLWIDALVRLRQVEMQPPPLSCGMPLNALSMAHLQNAARRANQLMKNLKSDVPRPVCIRTLFVDPGAKILCIPGTNLVVTHVPGSVSCWDILTSCRVGHLEIHSLRLETPVVCLEATGKALIGASISKTVRHLAAIWIDFRDRACVSISRTVSRATNANYFFRSHCFMDTRVLGFCTNSQIVFWGLDPNGKLEICLQDNCCPPRSPTPTCVLFGGRIYIFHRGANLEQVEVYSVPFSPVSEYQPGSLNYNIAPPSTTNMRVTYPFHPNQKELLDAAALFSFTVHAPHVFAPECGIYAVTCTDLGPRTSSVVHFRPARRSTAHDMLEIGPGCVYGHPDLIRQTAVGGTRRYVLIRVASPSEESISGYLGLLHFSPTSSQDSLAITFRKLDIGGISLDFCGQIALDDSLGLVLVLDDTGTMTAISYV